MATRFTLDDSFIERQASTKILGVWFGWKNYTKEILKRVFAAMSNLTKLKYAGLSRKKLINIYCLFVRSSAEYCLLLWHGN